MDRGDGAPAPANDDIAASDDITSVIELTDLGGDRFSGPNLTPGSRVYGGQLLAQSLVAAARTAPGTQALSLHLAFGRAGDLGRRVVVEVERVGDSRAVCTRVVRCHQGDDVLAAGTVVLHVPDASDLAHQELAAPAVADPDAAAPIDINLVPGEVRRVDDVTLADRAARPATFRWWFRCEPSGGDAVGAQAVLAHATNRTLIGTALRPFDGLSERDSPATLQTAVLVHDVQFHGTVEPAGWLLLDHVVPVVREGRAFGRGDVYDRSGRLVASFAQISVIRRKRP